MHACFASAALRVAYAVQLVYLVYRMGKWKKEVTRKTAKRPNPYSDAYKVMISEILHALRSIGSPIERRGGERRDPRWIASEIFT